MVENGKWLDVEPANSGLPGAGKTVGTAVSAVVAASVGVAIVSSKYSTSSKAISGPSSIAANQSAI